jgi:hypothetical protein
MTIQEFLTTCLLRFGQDQTNQRFTDDFFSSLNDAQNDIAVSRSWGFLLTSSNLTTTTSTRTVSLPSDFLKPYDDRGSLRITSPSGSLGNTIQLMTMDEWYSNFYEDGSDTGEPVYAYIMGESLYLSPVPDAAYTIALLYYKIPSNIADTSSAITIPAAYQELLKKMVFRRLQDAGYSSVQEITISDNDIYHLMANCARDDIRKYGGFQMNLNPNTYSRRTI